MATARRQPTTPNTNTYNSGGGANYSALGTWETDTDNDLVTAAAGEILQVQSNSHDDSIIMNGSTTSSSYYRLIEPASGNEPSGKRSTVLHFSATATGDILRVNENNSGFNDISGQQNINTATNANFVFDVGAQGSSARFVGCICGGSTNSGTGTARGYEHGNNSSGVGFILCIAENNDGTGFRITNGTGIFFYNCVSVGGGDYGYETTVAGEPTCINCLADDNTTAGWGGTGSFHSNSNYNAGADTTPPGANSRQSQTFTFVSAGTPNFDYHLTTSDAGARNFGTSLASDGTYPFDQDIDEDTFSTWDIGFDEPGEAGGAIQPPNMIPRVRRVNHLLMR